MKAAEKLKSACAGQIAAESNAGAKTKRRRILALPRELSPRRARWMMASIISLAAILRAAALNFPPALTDEAFTFWRVCGTLGQMLDNLRDDAFVPLHYEIVWLLTKILGADVWVLRLPSAIAGAVLPYAIYRLGRLVGGRRAGVASATVAATSEFIAYFARNAKMYMPAWTLMTLALGSLLFFARARNQTRSRRMAWLTFVLFGVAATSMHAVVCIPLTLSPLVALAWARRRRLTTLLLVLIATTIVMAAPIIFYSTINTWFVRAGGLSGRSEDGPAERDNGLMWIAGWQSGRSAKNVLLECLSAYTGGIEWPEDHQTLTDPLAESIRLASRDLMIGIVVCCGLAILATAARGGHGIRIGHLLIFLLLILLPLYAFYLRSYRTFLAPWELGTMAWIVGLCSCLAVAMGNGRAHRSVIERFASAIGWLLILSAVMTVTWAGARYAYAHAPLDDTGLPRWNPLWMPRYSGFVAPLLCVLIGCIIAATPTWPLRWLIAGSVVGLNLWLTALSLTTYTEVPWPQIVHDVVAASPRNNPLGNQPANNNEIVAMDWIRLPGQPFMSILPAPYYALVRDEQLDTDPPGFRNGSTWPYRPGTDVRRAMASLKYEPAWLLQTAVASQHPDRIVLWQSDRAAKFSSDPLSGWHIIDQTTYVERFVWNWEKIATYRRLVLAKN